MKIYEIKKVGANMWILQEKNMYYIPTIDTPKAYSSRKQGGNVQGLLDLILLGTEEPFFLEIL